MTPEAALAAWRKAVVQEDIKAGQKVRVKNSVSTDAAYLNGQVGQVEDWNETLECWRVVFANGDAIHVQAQNLTPLSRSG